ncbi:uncharacterized protein EDB91DRAFT_1143690 [Suillus paluster]|uniref:uncharacterized protein n=1 Tax=Suillus paluster TaxID=48578 RepID=UPI001B880510|nr:uncharacterized protein EDB91DRAFT_1143690 [Suillus paluster]KAG1735947.1 hypothetical protein EDB91DRAFT_1143690 [Suillus paluster]
MTDGTRLRQTWQEALDGAEATFRQLLNSHSSSEWKHISLASDSSSPGKGKSRASSNPELTDVAVHRKAIKSGENVYRVVLDVPITDQSASLDAWKAVITTPELRQEWDPAVESAHLVEMFDRQTRISKTNFTLGWPANPRDTVTISRLYQDTSTIIDISTSLPRSSDEPAYLRPSPPYVRSHVALFAWCIQYVQPSPAPQPNSPAGQIKRRMSAYIAQPRLRITCFWQHDLRAIWNFGSASSVCQQLCTMMLGLYKTVLARGSRIPVLAGHGYGVSIEKIRFQLDRQALAIEYVIHTEEEDHTAETGQGLDVIKEHRRLVRSLECVLPSNEGWDVQLTVKGSSQKVESLPWNATALRQKPSSPVAGSKPPELTVLRISHAPLPDDHSIIKVRAVIELSAPSSGIRLNGLPQTIQVVEERDPLSFVQQQQQQQILQDATSAADVSFQTTSSVSSVASSSTAPTRPQLARSLTERPAAAEKTILSRVKRSYIYFSSLLQEPEAKWKRTTEARGVSVTQLDSIDPTLVVYRAEATFVGLGLWDLYGALVSPGARVFWDKQHEDAVLLEDVNELTQLWHFKTKPAWPVQGRDTVLLKTVYKSPTTIHVFSFSADDPYLFPSIPPQDPTLIRTQVDLLGWAIETLSPNTTQLTLLEQSDPKGWSNKAGIPQSMISSLAGVGDFVIKCGGPPVVTRLAGAKANEMRYDHERGAFRVEYEGSESRRSPTTIPEDPANESAVSTNSRTMHTIECEIRCDMDTWASALDVVVDPPPHSVSALRRHRLSAGGGGLWLTLTHDALFAADERLLAIVRRGPMGSGKDKGIVMVNGARVTVDVEELPEQEIKALAKRKRIKPLRIPLDQPPVVGVIRRRRAEWDADGDSPSSESTPRSLSPEPLESAKPSSTWLTSPKFSSPLASFWSTAVESATNTTQQAVAAMAPGDGGAPSASRAPMQHAAEALQWMRDLQCGGPDAKAGWTALADKAISVHRKLLPDISPSIPVHKGEKVIEGVSAEEVAAVVTNYECRKQWDVRFASASILERFGSKCHTAFVVSKGGFPFRDRGFFQASIMARSRLPLSSLDVTPGETGPSQDARSVIFCVSASFSPDSVASYSPSKYNPYALPIGRTYIDGWMFETLDPYTKENYAIPSTRCTRVVAVDCAGSIPVAVNSLINSALPKSILAVETYLKGNSPMPYTRLPAAGVVLAEQKSGTGVNAPSWRLRKKDDNRRLIVSTFNPLNRTHCSVLLLTLANITSSRTDETTPRPSRAGLALSPAPDARASPVDIPTSPSIPSHVPNPRRTSSASVEPLKPSSSAFTLKGEIRHSTDLLVAEIVVDSKLYPEGYEVLIISRPRDNTKFISVESDTSSDSTDLPISSNVYTIPASPLHSSGLNADRPPRHLLRLTLPTAQYQVSTVKDPLTGETRSAPPKPQWFNDLHERGFVVRVEIKPVVTSALGAKKGDGGVAVKVGGANIGIASEKESLTALGRDELQDDRVSRMPVLQRSADDGDSFPDELKVPLSRADDLLDNGAIIPATDINEDPEAPEENGPKAEVIENGPSLDAPEHGTVLQVLPQPPSSGGLFGFLNAYPNPLSRWASSPTKDPVSLVPSLPGGLTSTETDATSPPVTTSIVRIPTTYPLSTVLIIALIAFLIGSLLRSLLSPADFIYVVTDLQDAEEGSAGWREIRRLLEVKYIVGGWDFQIAVVRRH